MLTCWVELDGVAHFAAHERSHRFRNAEHASANVGPSFNVALDPVRSAVAEAFCLDPSARGTSISILRCGTSVSRRSGLTSRTRA